MIEKYLLLMGLGHVLGDFYFQTEKIAQKKEEAFSGVLLHCFEYLCAVMITILPVMSSRMLLLAAAMAVMHFLIDAGKFVLQQKKIIKKSGRVFIADQLIHLLSLFMMAYIMYKMNFDIVPLKIVKDIFSAFGLESKAAAKWILVILILHKPANILIQSLLSGYKPRTEKKDLIVIDNQAGRQIGTLERMIMLMFLAVNQYAALGLVLTAKSIARYDRIAKDEKFAEYYLLGTLLSTACVVLLKVLFLAN